MLSVAFTAGDVNFRWSELVNRDWLTLSRDHVTWENVNSSSWEVFAGAGHQPDQMVVRSAVNSHIDYTSGLKMSGEAGSMI